MHVGPTPELEQIAELFPDVFGGKSFSVEAHEFQRTFLHVTLAILRNFWSASGALGTCVRKSGILGAGEWGELDLLWREEFQCGRIRVPTHNFACYTWISPEALCVTDTLTSVTFTLALALISAIIAAIQTNSSVANLTPWTPPTKPPWTRETLRSTLRWLCWNTTNKRMLLDTRRFLDEAGLRKAEDILKAQKKHEEAA